MVSHDFSSIKSSPKFDGLNFPMEGQDDSIS